MNFCFVNVHVIFLRKIAAEYTITSVSVKIYYLTVKKSHHINVFVSYILIIVNRKNIISVHVLEILKIAKMIGICASVQKNIINVELMKIRRDINLLTIVYVIMMEMINAGHIPSTIATVSNIKINAFFIKNKN